jgi:hypothetical protein
MSTKPYELVNKPDEEGDIEIQQSPMTFEEEESNSSQLSHRKGFIKMATGTIQESYTDYKKSTADLAKEIQVECFEQLEVYESLQFLKDNWSKFIFIPYLPAFHRPGWMVRYVVGPHTPQLMMNLMYDCIAGITVALTLIPQVSFRIFVFSSMLPADSVVFLSFPIRSSRRYLMPSLPTYHQLMVCILL